MMETSNKISNDQSAASVTSKLNSDILDVLRRQNGFPIERYSGLSETLEGIQQECAKRLATFVGEKVEGGLGSVELFTIELEDETDKRDEIYIRVDVDEEKFLFGFSISSVDFRSFLRLALAQREIAQTANAATELSISEKKLLQRFVDQLSECLFERFEFLSYFGVPRNPIFIERKDLTNIAEHSELLTIPIVFHAQNKEIRIEFTVPLELLKFGSEEAEKTEGRRAKDQAEREWKQNLRTSIEVLEIPLVAEFINAELPLNEIGELKIGQTLSLVFGSSPVPIKFDEGTHAFFANAEHQDKKLLLRVSGRS